MLVCCGLTTLDMTQVVERLPAPDEKVTALSLDVDLGGPAANAATTAVALGGSRPRSSRRSVRARSGRWSEPGSTPPGCVWSTCSRAPTPTRPPRPCS